MGDLVSIIVAKKKKKKYLRQCLDSLVAQTYQNLDIILVDDGSTDQSGCICDEYGIKDVRIRVVHKKNEGLVMARKTGLHMAIGKYCVYVDGDDWLESEAVQILMDYREKYQADVVIGNYSRYDGQKKIPHENFVQERLYADENLISGIYSNMLYDSQYHDFGVSPNVWGNLYQRETLLEIQEEVPNEVTYGEDVAVLYFLLFKSRRVGIIDAAVYNYVVNLESMTKSYHQNQTKSTTVLLNYLYHKVEKVPYPDFKKQLNNYAIRIMNANFENEARQGLKYFRDGKERLVRFEQEVGILEIIKSGNYYELSKNSKITTWLVKHGLSGLLLIYMEIKGFVGRCRKTY